MRPTLQFDRQAPAAVTIPLPGGTAANVADTAIASGRGRVDSVDILRGVAMILMALDHTRDFFGNAAADPTNLATASTALFLTRWVTHFCAPVFFLLTGTGAYLSLRKRSRGELSRFLLTRGAALVLLELTVTRALLQFNLDYRVTILNVIWALGWSMIALAALCRLPLRLVVTFGLAMIALHNLADGIPPAAFGRLAPLWIVLHQPGVLVAAGGRLVFLAYPLIPWIGVTAVGFGLGRLFELPVARRRSIMLAAGATLVSAFILLRLANVYGDPRPWTGQASALRTLVSFLNTTKYPPSLLFLAMTLGPALLALGAMDAWLERKGTAALPVAARPVLVFGRVPLFYYLLHLGLIHLLAVAASAWRFHGVRWMFESPSLDRFPVTQPPGWPAPLPWVYAAWLLVVVLAYPACRWYAALKARRKDAWLSYL